MELTILRYETLDSTNSEVMRQAKQGAREGLCVIADKQTAGRGRHGRVWASAKDSGLYFSVLLRPKLPPRLMPLITLMTAVSVHDTLLKFAVNADIKWVNDLLVSEKKISGILAEASDIGGGPTVVVGIGINLTSGNFPPEISDTATSIEGETGLKPDKALMIERLLDALLANYDLLQSDSGAETIRRLWSERSSYAEGKSVQVRTGGEEFSGITRGIEENGALRIETEDGVIRTIQAGEVEKLRSED